MRLVAVAGSVVFLAALSAAVPARCEIALLTNGETLKVDAWQLNQPSIHFLLHGGGEITLQVSEVGAIVPDEVAEPGPPAATIAPPVPARTAAVSGDPIRRLAVDAGRRHAVDPALVLAVIDVESAFQTQAVSPKGAMGLMQLMPATAAALGVADPFDASANVEGGVRHLRALLDQYGGDQRLALAAYNAGATAVARYGGVPPFQETQDYVRRVLRKRERYP
jgi:hypothetical protein